MKEVGGILENPVRFREEGCCMKKNYYDVLGIQKNADEKEIRKAFRKLAKKYHPDTNPGNKEAERCFKEVNEAYDVLGNSEKKALYDKYGDIALQEGFDPEAYEAYQRNGFGGSRNVNGQTFHFDGDLDDLFSGFFSGRTAGDHFSGFDSRESFYRRQGPVKGPDLHSDISISFDDAVSGCDKVFSLMGTDGKQTSVQVHIPAGIDEGQKVRLKGKGSQGMNGGPSGDLFLKVHIIPKNGFERKGQDVYVTVPIPFTTAALGGEVIVPTLDGKAVCRIKPGTQAGSKIRLRGKGIVSMKDPSVFGDEYIVIQIEVPRVLSEEQRKKLEEYAALSGHKKSDGRAA